MIWVFFLGLILMIKALFRHFWAFCMVNIMKRIAQKLRRIILLHLGLVTFRCHYGRTRKPLMFMIWGFLNVSTTPKTNIIYLWRHQNTLNNSRKNTESILENLCGKVKISELQLFELFGKDGDRTIPTIFLRCCLKILDMGSISFKNMKWEFRNMESPFSENIK